MQRTYVATEVLKDAVQLACRAPSVHNSQPWQWIADSGALELHLDESRLVTTDSSHRQALMSCGAVLDHLAVAMAAAGWTTSVDRYPNPNDHKHLASVYFTELDYVTDGHRQRAEAIRQRRTDRLPFAAPADWSSFESELLRVVGDAAVVDVLDDSDRPALVKASVSTEDARLYDSAYHAELDWWTSSFDPTAGIPRSALISAAETDRVAVGRRFPVTHHQDQRQEVPEDRSRIVVMSTYDDTRVDLLRCGEALSAALLSATMAGLSSCTLTHLTEVAASREVIRSLTGHDLPQVLIRMGRTPSGEVVPPPTPRRRLDEVLTIHR